MLIQEESLLADIACIEPIAVHGFLGLVNLGETFLACYFRWQAVKSEGGIIVRERVPAISLLQPRCAAIPGGRFDQWLSVQPTARTDRTIALVH